MDSFKRRASAVLLALALVLGLPSAAGAFSEKGADNVVQVINTTSNSFRAKSRVHIPHNPGPEVLNQNIADARASCVQCRTVAVAAQVVLVEGPYTNYQPFNLAFAYNENCQFCQTYAYARQVVLSPLKPVTISESARDKIEAVEGQIRRISRTRTMTFPEMDAALDAQVEKMVAIVQEEINRAGTQATREDRKAVDEDTLDN